LFAGYRADAHGELTPDGVQECPYPDGRPCQIQLNHSRDRKTGPKHPLVVLECLTHGHAFTVYPPGHVPYGRKAVAPVAEDGSLLRRATDEDVESTSRPLSWEVTVFTAALDASQGHAWPREAWPWTREAGSVPAAEGLWATQLRWMRRCEALLGLAPEMTPSTREQLAWQLGVPCLVLIAASQSLAGSRGYRARGQVIEHVLRQLPTRPRLVDDLVAAGYVAGLWGRPSRWDPGGAGGGVLRPLFRDAGTPSGARRGAAGSGPTTFES
jgi:hypothetical protein